MRRVQAAALDLFEAHGFDAVTVEAIAAAAGVGPATVYRGFGAKERIVLWDEYDPMLLDAIAARLDAGPPLVAVGDALGDVLGRVYAADRARVLRRARLIAQHPPLRAAAAVDREALRGALADLFARRGGLPDRLAADVAAGAVVATLEAAAHQWLRGRGRTPLVDLLREAFQRLRDVASRGPARGAYRRRSRQSPSRQ